ncbi:MAG: hypothetical protein IPK92_14650 [Nitrospira sp.]|nr:hypothetical protein [Nitrospira sp.]
MSDHGSFDQETRNDRSDEPSLKIGTDPLELIEQCLATFQTVILGKSCCTSCGMP